MQAPDMRTLHSQKHIITLGLIHKSLSRPRFVSVQSLRFYHAHSDPSSETHLASAPGNGTPNADVFTPYDSLTGRVVSRRGSINAINPDSGEDGGRTYLDEGDRTYGSVRKAKSAPRPSFDRRVPAPGERAFQKGRIHGFWVCSNCGHREGQKWESCRSCRSAGTMNYDVGGNGNRNVNKTSGFGISGNRFSNYGRERTYGNAEKASVSDFHKDRAFGDAKKESVGEWLNTEEVAGNKKSVNDMRETQVSGNSVFPSLEKQAGEVNPQPMMVEKVTRWTSRGVSDDDFIDGRVSANINTGGDVSGEKAATFSENDSSTHGLGKGLTSEAVQGNETSGLEASEEAVYSSHPNQVTDALWSPLIVKQELDLTSQNEVQTGLPTSGNEINDLNGGGTEGSVRRSKWVSGSVSSSGVDEGVKDSSKERAFRVVEKGGSTHGFGQEFSVEDVVTTTKKKKGKTVWVCSNCGHNEGQWWGSCKGCNNVGTMKRFSIGDYGGSGDNTGGFEGSDNAERSWLPKRADQVLPLRLTDVNRGINKLEWRIPLSGSFGSEVARVLGGGLVPGSLVLVGGDPGVGKSTLLLQLAAIIAEGHDVREPGPVVYVSGEESVEQIGNRADRMDIGAKELFLYSGTDIEDILGKAHLLSPRLLIVDSIQTVYLKDVTGSAGGLSQVKECTSALLRYSKKTNVPVLLIGHVTKTGDIAGPRVLEHIVDVVLYLEGEKYTSHRLLRSIKNRFGSTDELGVFEMSQSGLMPVANPSEMYLTEQQSDSEFLVGLAVAVVMDGTRSFLIEIQALCVAGSKGSRHFNGVQDSRADMIVAVLTKQACLKLQDGAIFLNVVSGVTLAETAGDLAIAAAICSSFLELPIPSGFAFIGEIGLSGELRGVPRMDIRVNTVAQLGYKKCIVPKSALKSLKGLNNKEMEIIGCKNLKQVIGMVFATPMDQP